jgi:hypothetical protein
MASLGTIHFHALYVKRRAVMLRLSTTKKNKATLSEGKLRR